VRVTGGDPWTAEELRADNIRALTGLMRRVHALAFQGRPYHEPRGLDRILRPGGGRTGKQAALGRLRAAAMFTSSCWQAFHPSWCSPK